MSKRYLFHRHGPMQATAREPEGATDDITAVRRGKSSRLRVPALDRGVAHLKVEVDDKTWRAALRAMRSETAAVTFQAFLVGGSLGIRGLWRVRLGCARRV
jgi:hypothetical protein